LIPLFRRRRKRRRKRRRRRRRRMMTTMNLTKAMLASRMQSSPRNWKR
jgi:hypothetical protein